MSYKDPEVQREYARRWMGARRDSWLADNGPCVHCESWDDLEVDHTDPATKAMQPSAIWSRRQEARDAELAKCQVLCHDCHMVKTASAISGEGSPLVRLTEGQAMEILRRSGENHAALAREFGVSRQLVVGIVYGQNWKHLPR